LQPDRQAEGRPACKQALTASTLNSLHQRLYKQLLKPSGAMQGDSIRER